ncbi:hypothetical protein VCRA2130O400_360031 [Vibrio crassostreae]|nr:hypothetical protein VCRA2130O400_360031 [Vibrio crassostreae]
MNQWSSCLSLVPIMVQRARLVWESVVKTIMWANAAIEIAWIASTVYLVVNNHTGWAVATFVAALISGYSTSSKQG